MIVQRIYHSTTVSGKKMMLSGKGSANPLKYWKAKPAADAAKQQAQVNAQIAIAPLVA